MPPPRTEQYQPPPWEQATQLQLEPPPKKTFNTIEPIYAAALTEECMASVPPIPWIHAIRTASCRRCGHRPSGLDIDAGAGSACTRAHRLTGPTLTPSGKLAFKAKHLPVSWLDYGASSCRAKSHKSQVHTPASLLFLGSGRRSVGSVGELIFR